MGKLPTVEITGGVQDIQEVGGRPSLGNLGRETPPHLPSTIIFGRATGCFSQWPKEYTHPL